MLQSMHDKIQGLVAWVFAVIIALTFALWGIQNYLHGGASQTVAKVNGKKITQEEFRLAYEQAKRSEMLRSGPGFSFDQKGQAELKKDVLQHLIKQEVILQAEADMGLGVSKKQLWSIVVSQPIFQVQGHFSLSGFQNMIRRLFPSEQAFFDNMENAILRTQLERGITESDFILPHEVELLKKVYKQRRDFGYFVIPVESFISKVQIDSAAIKNYYDQHNNEFLLPEKISVQYVELSASDFQNKAKPSAEQLKQFYQSHIDSFSTPQKWQIIRVLFPLSPKASSKDIDNAKKKLEEIKAQLKDGKELAGEDRELRINTSWVTRNDVPPDIAVHLAKLAINQVSEPVRTKDGYNLIKVLAKQESKVSPYESVAGKIKEACEHQQLMQAFSEASDRLSDLVYTNSDSLEPAAKELGLKIKETGLITRAGSRDGIFTSHKIFNAAFSEVVLKQRYNSSLIEVSSGKIVVLRIKDYVPEKLQPLAQVQGIITEKLRHEEARKMAASLADELLRSLSGGKSESELASQRGLVWHKLSGSKYGQGGDSAKLVDAVFGLTRLGSGKVSATKVDFGSGYAVLRLDKVYEEAANGDAKIDGVIKSLPGKLGQFAYQTLLDTLMSQAKIEIIDKAEDEQSIVYE